MATTYKSLLDDDVTSAKTLLHENIPLTGSIISSSLYNGTNVRSHTHGMFQSVYDYPWTSSSANQLFDMTVGITSTSPAKGSSDTFAQKKINIYNQMAQVLAGFDATGSILQFDRDGDYATDIVEGKYNSAFFLNFNRLLVKDEIKKGTFNLTLGISQSVTSPFGNTCIIKDTGAATNYKTNSPTGEYGILYIDSATGVTSSAQTDKSVGLIFYQAGVAVISANVFAVSGTNSPNSSLSSSTQGQLTTAPYLSGTANVETCFETLSIDNLNAAFRNRIQNINFSNTTELNSTIYFCRAGHNEFNYSSNPTYLSSSQIIVKDNNPSNPPLSYITTVGLYSPDNELLAVAKLSQPLKKTVTDELLLRVRLDY